MNYNICIGIGGYYDKYEVIGSFFKDGDIDKALLLRWYYAERSFLVGSTIQNAANRLTHEDSLKVYYLKWDEAYLQYTKDALETEVPVEYISIPIEVDDALARECRLWSTVASYEMEKAAQQYIMPWEL